MTELLDQEWDEIQTTELPPPPRDGHGPYLDVNAETRRIWRENAQRQRKIHEEFNGSRSQWDDEYLEKMRRELP